jgi:hypothetical protein
MICEANVGADTSDSLLSRNIFAMCYRSQSIFLSFQKVLSYQGATFRVPRAFDCRFQKCDSLSADMRNSTPGSDEVERGYERHVEAKGLSAMLSTRSW